MAKHRTDRGDAWPELWKQLEDQGNVGIDYIINPRLYASLADCLSKDRSAQVVDFGAGTGILGIEFLYGNRTIVPGLKGVHNLEQARKNIKAFISLENEKILVEHGKKYLSALGTPKNIDIRQYTVSEEHSPPFLKHSIDVCISRNFLMHLSTPDLAIHLSQTNAILKNHGRYILSVLNPDYEQWKHGHLQNKDLLIHNQRYGFKHGEKGEYGSFTQYWRSQRLFENMLRKNFHIEKKTYCHPTDMRFKRKYPRYYQEECPMAIVYSLINKA